MNKTTQFSWIAKFADLPKMLGSRVMAVFAHFEDRFELSRRVHGMIHIQRETGSQETDGYCIVLAKAYTKQLTVRQS